ncbi:MAG: acyl-CoA dehydratase activase [Candidatus Zixiibacteriota bacterium]
MGTTRTALGIDIGSVAVKVVLVREGVIERSVYRRFTDGPFETLRDIIQQDFTELTAPGLHVGLTGIGCKTAQSILGGSSFGEIAALAAANFHLLPNVRTVIEMGGEDSKLLILDTTSRAVIDFAMNAQCAAGTGSFLDQQAGRLNISIEEQFGQLALKSKNPARIAGRCSVFAKSDMIHLQQMAAPDYDIVAGLCFAVARNFKGAIARGKRFDPPVAFEGGVAANPGMVRAFTELLGLRDGELIIPEHFNVMSALGAALLALEAGARVQSFDPTRIDAYLKFQKVVESGRDALSYDHPDSKHYDVTLSTAPRDFDGLDLFMGIDIGSLSTNIVLIDRDRRVIARRYLMTEGRPIEAVRRGLAEVGLEVGERVMVRAVGTTGSGRYLIGDYVGADVVRNEITAQATAAVNIDPTVDTIFEIGGQDSKYISLRDRAVVDFEMNKACAAGTGSFLQEQAEKLKINIEQEFGEKALCAKCPVGCGERCTVFMESDLVAHQRSGARKEDLIAGLAYSIASNYLTKVVGDRRIGDNIFFQGGVAWNKGVVAAFEKLTGRKITVPPHHDVTGAIGAAILAIEKEREPGFATSFKGFDISRRPYRLDTFPCEDCSNHCEIRKVEIENEETLYYGARCEKYEVDKRSGRTLPLDFTSLRMRHLQQRYLEQTSSQKPRGVIGLPRVLHYFDYYPFWRAFFEAAGYRTKTSDLSNQRIVEESLELFSAETCFPIKLVYGHVANLLSGDVDVLFLPSLIKVADESQQIGDAPYVCPYVQTIGAALKARFNFADRGVRFLDPTIYFTYNADELTSQLRSLATELGLSDRQLKRAVAAGLKAYRAFQQKLSAESQKILGELKPDEKVLVLISRPYNGYDRRLSLDLPDKIRNLGYKVIPMDFLPLGDTQANLGNMYWRYGRRILLAADYIRKHPNLFAVYISSFGCGPDSFITHFFRKSMHGKPYLQLEIDEHSADAGLITRCEAFIDSLRYYAFEPPISAFSVQTDAFRPFEKTIYIPNMCDHAFPLKAAFERFGLTAEVMEESDGLTLDYGKKFTTGKECFPCVTTTGDMLKKIHSNGFDRSRSVFFMPGANGPCRFGLYSQFHRMVLDDLGYNDIPIYSPNSKDGYAQFGLDGTSFRTLAWKGMVFVDCLLKALHLVRPYEEPAGQAEQHYFEFLSRLQRVMVRDESLEELGEFAARAFAAVPTRMERRPVVGLVGEIYLRNNRFSNNHLVDKLERLGLEVRLAPFAEWPLYTSTTYLHESLRSRHWRGLVQSLLQLGVQMRHEHRIMKAFRKHLPIPVDDSVATVMRRASRYLSLDYKGEAVLSIGKAIEMVESGACGVVNAMPFNCMPGTVVSSLSRNVAQDLGNVPWLNISYEGLQDSAEDTRLEAFADQVRSFAMIAGRSPRPTGRAARRGKESVVSSEG